MKRKFKKGDIFWIKGWDNDIFPVVVTGQLEGHDDLYWYEIPLASIEDGERWDFFSSDAEVFNTRSEAFKSLREEQLNEIAREVECLRRLCQDYGRDINTDFINDEYREMFKDTM